MKNIKEWGFFIDQLVRFIQMYYLKINLYFRTEVSIWITSLFRYWTETKNVQWDAKYRHSSIYVELPSILFQALGCLLYFLVIKLQFNELPFQRKKCKDTFIKVGSYSKASSAWSGARLILLFACWISYSLDDISSALTPNSWKVGYIIISL